MERDAKNPHPRGLDAIRCLGAQSIGTFLKNNFPFFGVEAMAHRETKTWNKTKAAADLEAASVGASTATFTHVGTKLKFAKEITVDAGFAQTVDDFVECDYDGYAEFTLDEVGGDPPEIQGPVNINSTTIGNVTLVNGVCTADQEDPGQSVVAVYQTSGDDTLCLGYEKFAPGQAVPILNDGDYLQYDWKYPIKESVAIP
jgi:hypothetical protein